MRYRIRQKGRTITVSIEDGNGNEIASAPAKDMDEAEKLRAKALAEGPDALGTKKKGA